jgi:hypothetical protein
MGQCTDAHQFWPHPNARSGIGVIACHCLRKLFVPFVSHSK